MKQCKKCGIEKSYDEFHKYKKSQDGLQAYCIVCNKTNAIKWQNNNGKRYRQNLAKWRTSNGIGVYGLWNKNEECYDYVGQGRLNDREAHHRKPNHKTTSTPREVILNVWFDGFDNVYEFRILCKCDTKEQCKELETKYIAELNPRYNKKQRQHKVEA
jgi:hypothetical protein